MQLTNYYLTEEGPAVHFCKQRVYTLHTGCDRWPYSIRSLSFLSFILNISAIITKYSYFCENFNIFFQHPMVCYYKIYQNTHWSWYFQIIPRAFFITRTDSSEVFRGDIQQHCLCAYFCPKGILVLHVSYFLPCARA